MIKYSIFYLLLLLVISCEQDKKAAEKDSKIVTNLPYFNSAAFTPEWNNGNHKIPAFSFTNQNDSIITNNFYKGKIYIANFFFTSCPGICSRLTNNMGLLQEQYALDTDLLLVSYSVMPWYDTVSVLGTYAKTHGVNSSKWNLLTGKKNEIYALAREGFFADEDFTKTQLASDFIHTENFVLVDKKGYIRGVYNGTIELDLQRLIRHIEILKKES